MADEEEQSSIEIVPSESKLCKDISSLYFKHKFADVCFLVNDHKLYAHKIILAARSQYFEALLYGGLEESKQEEITVEDVPLKAFKMLLRYIYTDEICVTSCNTDLVFQVFTLANKYCMKDLQDVITSKLKPMIGLHNVCPILNIATLCCATELKLACFSLLEENSLEFLNNGFLDLTRESLIELIQRDTFYAPEMDIFRAVTKWLKEKEDVDNSVAKCIRLCCLDIDDILREVWLEDIFTENELLYGIAEIRGIFPKKNNPRAILVPDENVVDRGAEALGLGNTKVSNFSVLNYTEATKDHFLNHKINTGQNITVKLWIPTVVNHIHLILRTTCDENYSYYVEVSLDQTNWEKIVDHSQYPCRSVQNLFFVNIATRFIKIVGTRSNNCNTFSLSCFEAYYKTDVPPMVNHFIRPLSNIATAENGALVIKGSDPSFLLNGDTKNYTPHTGYTHHTIRTSPGIVIQLAQPFVLSSMKLLLWDLDDRHYRYYIETSVDNMTWEVVADRRNADCRSWQSLFFDERLVVFIQIVGTANTANEGFHCVHFECPSDDYNEELNIAVLPD